MCSDIVDVVVSVVGVGVGGGVGVGEGDGVDESESYEEHFPHSTTIGTCLAAYQLLTNATVDLLETRPGVPLAEVDLSGGAASDVFTRSGSGGGGGGAADPPSFAVATAGMSGASQILAFSQAQVSYTGTANYKHMMHNAPVAYQSGNDEYMEVYEPDGGHTAAIARSNSSQEYGF